MESAVHDEGCIIGREKQQGESMSYDFMTTSVAGVIYSEEQDFWGGGFVGMPISDT